MASFSVPVVQDTEQLQAGTGRQRVQADAEAFGAREARGLGAVAEGLGQVAEVAKQKETEFDRAEAVDLDNQLSQRIRDRFYNTTDGYLSTQRGLNALNSRAQVESDIDQYAGELANSTRNPRAAAMFRQAAMSRLSEALGQVAEHASRENTNYQNTVSESRLNEFLDNAVAAYGDPAAVAANVDGGIGEINAVGDRLGWDTETRADRIRQFRSDAMSRVIVQTATGDPQAAEDLFARLRPDLTAQDAAELRTTMRAAQAQAQERVVGAIWQAYANGQDPRALPEWAAFTTNPLFGQEHEQFNQYRRERARQAVSNTLTDRQSRDAGDMLEAQGAMNPRAFMLITDYATGRLSVGLTMPRHPRPDMTPEQFQRETGLSPTEARTIFSRLRPADLLRVLNRRNGTTDNQAADQAYDDIRRVAEPMAESLGLRVTGTAERDTEVRGAFRAYLYREAQAYVQSHGARPDDAAIQDITRRALIHSGNRYAFQATPDVDREGRIVSRRDNGEGVRRGVRIVIPYQEIPVDDRRAIEADLAASLGRAPNASEVEERYADYLQATGVRAP